MAQDTRRESYEDSDMIVNYHDAVVYGSDLRLLESPTAWLNDAAINFHFTYLQQQQQQQQQQEHTGSSQDRFMDPSVVSFFMHQCTDEEDIEEFANNVNFPKTGRIFIPVNDSMDSASMAWLTPQSGQHWSLLLICRIDGQTKGMWHFDSVRNSANQAAAQDIVLKLQTCVFPRQSSNPSSPSNKLVQARTPQQANGYDCGVHVLFSADLFSTTIQFIKDDDNDDDNHKAPLQLYEKALQQSIEASPDFALHFRAKVVEAIYASARKERITS